MKYDNMAQYVGHLAMLEGFQSSHDINQDAS